MTTAKSDRGNCRFLPRQAQGIFTIELQLFHPTVPVLAEKVVEFELLKGTNASDAKVLADAMNERILGIVITPAASE